MGCSANLENQTLECNTLPEWADIPCRGSGTAAQREQGFPELAPPYSVLCGVGRRDPGISNLEYFMALVKELDSAVVAVGKRGRERILN